MSSLQSLSLAKKLLLGIFAVSLVAVGLSFAGAYQVFHSRFEAQKVSDLEMYARERTRTEQSLFTQLNAKYAGATREMIDRYESMEPEATWRELDRFFPLQADGTRRSIPELYDGISDGAGGRIFGMAAFIPDAASMTDDEAKVILAAARIVFASGPSGFETFDNFYFFTPQNRLVMFGPAREDRLIYYRRDAPPDFNFQHEEMSRLVRPELNPAGVMRCTRLRRLISSPGTRRMSTGCYQPVTIDGRQVGAWGVTIPVGDRLMRSVNDVPAGATGRIVSSQGQLIAWPGFTGLSEDEAEAFAAQAREKELPTLMEQIHRTGRDHGVVETPDGDGLVAFGRMGGPDWYFLISMPKAEIRAAANQSARVILLIGALALALQTALVLWIARRLIAAPLARLAEHSADPEGSDVSDLEARRDEIGVLARALATERGRSRELLDTLESRVRERTRALERANDAKSAFLANMSHELRTPLNGVVALADLLKSRQTDEGAREMAALIVSSGRLLEQVINDILDVSKIEAGQLKLESEPFDLGGCLEKIASLHAAAAAAKGIRLVWNVAPAAAGTYVGDPTRITQVLSNLLSNAVKFTDQGEVRLTARASKRGLRLSVRDTGIGFNAQTAQRLFRRFEQADASMTRKYGGTGLGLSICASLTHMMGGDIEVRSSPGKGSLFTVILPLERAEAPAAAPAEDAAPATPEAPAARPLRILLAEDHATNQRVVALILEPLGVDLTIVGDGAQALEQAMTSRFDLILMDVQMPEMDGLTATRKLRAHEAAQGLERTPVISLTANALPEHVEASLAAGADRHLAKPIRPDTLIGAVSEIAASIAQAEAEASAA